MICPLRLVTIGMLVSLGMSAAELAGIWTGQMSGRNNEKQDVAFQFKSSKGSFVGVMFGDEFDIEVQDLSVEGDHISFSITSINYYDGRRTKFVYTGTIHDQEMQLTRERSGAPPPNANANKREPAKQTFTLKRLS
jgi:hypothetical protein